ncbi:sulfite exporter TauE/SafE family protein [Proteobacteria bacterium 005FR1]|nr:sulfite exporter TauE/SafE family protein [Proteobacteria bacterium 005FR1]
MLAAAAVIFVGAFVQTSIGFGLAIVSAPFLFYLDKAYVPAPIIIAALANGLFTTWHFRAHLSFGGLKSAIIWRIPGSLAGVGLLMIISEKTLAVLIAIVIASGILTTYFRLHVPFSQRNLGIAGFLSGLMGTSTSIGGPPMAIVMQGQVANAIRGNLAAFFIFSCITSIVVLFPTGYLGMSELILAAPLIPASLLGSWLASRFSGRIDDEMMRWGCLVLCSVSVVAMLLQYLA